MKYHKYAWVRANPGRVCMIEYIGDTKNPGKEKTTGIPLCDEGMATIESYISSEEWFCEDLRPGEKLCKVCSQLSPYGRKTHVNKTPCLSGTRQLPPDFKACCEVFEDHTTACTFDIRYIWIPDKWGIEIDNSAGGGMIFMKFCPHCGVKLPSA